MVPHARSTRLRHLPVHARGARLARLRCRRTERTRLSRLGGVLVWGTLGALGGSERDLGGAGRAGRADGALGSPVTAGPPRRYLAIVAPGQAGMYETLKEELEQEADSPVRVM